MNGCNKLQDRIEELEVLCSELYQIVGNLVIDKTFGSPDVQRVLDKLHAASEGKPLPEGSLLPFNLKE